MRGTLISNLPSESSLLQLLTSLNVERDHNTAHYTPALYPKFLRHISEPSHNNSRIGLVMSILQTCGLIFLRIIRKGGSGNERIFGFLAVDAHRALAMLRFVDVDSQVALAIGKDERVLVALLILLLVLPVTAVVDGEIIIESYLPIAGRIVAPKRGEELFDAGIDILDAQYLEVLLPSPSRKSNFRVFLGSGAKWKTTSSLPELGI